MELTLCTVEEISEGEIFFFRFKSFSDFESNLYVTLMESSPGRVYFTKIIIFLFFHRKRNLIPRACRLLVYLMQSPKN